MRFQLTDCLVPAIYTCGGRELQLELLADFGAAVAQIEAQVSASGGLLPDDVIPYYSAIWPAAEVLAREAMAVLKLPAPPEAGPMRILELGAGLGLPALVAAGCGGEVTAVDINPDALALLGRNAARNGLKVNLILSDWRAVKFPPEASGFDVILASDVLYEPYHVNALADLASRILKSSGRMLLTDPCRWHYQDFVRALERNGFTVDARFEDVHDDVGRTRVVCVTARP